MNTRITDTASWIGPKGKSIYFADYSKVEMLDIRHQVKMNEAAILDLGQGGNAALLILNDVSGCDIDNFAFAALKSTTDTLWPYIKGSATVGVTGLRVYALELVNKFARFETKPFSNLEEAKDWLVSLKQRSQTLRLRSLVPRTLKRRGRGFETEWSESGAAILHGPATGTTPVDPITVVD